MKKIIAAVLAVSLIAGVLSGCKSSQPAAGSVSSFGNASAAVSTTEAVSAQETAAEPTPTGQELTAEDAQALVEKYFDVWAIYLETFDGYMVFRCYNDYDPRNDKFDDYVGLVQIDTRSGAMVVLDGMTDDREKVDNDPNVTAVPTESDAPVSAAPASAEPSVTATAAPAATAAAEPSATPTPVTMFVSNVTVCCYLLSNNDPTHLDIIDTIPFGVGITVLDNTGETFYKVTYNGKTGYVNKAFLVTTRPSKTFVITGYMFVNNVEVACYLLDDPKTKNPIATVNLGTEVGIIDKSNKDYYVVEYKGQIGYISTSYLTDTPPASTVKVTKDMYVANVNISCYLWSDANGTTPVDTIPLGTRVGYVDAANDTFYRVVYGDQVGYVNKAYLSDTKPADPTPTPAPTATATPTPAPTATPTPEPTATPTPEPSEDPSPEPTATPTPEPSEEPSPAPTATATPEPSEEPSPTPSVKPYYDDAKELTPDTAKNGSFDKQGQKDHYSVDVTDGTVSLTFTPANPMSIGDIVIEVYDADGKKLASTEKEITDDGDGNLKGSFSADAGTLYIGCYLKNGTDLSYTIKVG